MLEYINHHMHLNKKIPKKKTLFCHNSETFDCASRVHNNGNLVIDASWNNKTWLVNLQSIAKQKNNKLIFFKGTIHVEQIWNWNWPSKFSHGWKSPFKK